MSGWEGPQSRDELHRQLDAIIDAQRALAVVESGKSRGLLRGKGGAEFLHRRIFELTLDLAEFLTRAQRAVLLPYHGDGPEAFQQALWARIRRLEVLLSRGDEDPLDVRHAADELDLLSLGDTNTLFQPPRRKTPGEAANEARVSLLRLRASEWYYYLKAEHWPAKAIWELLCRAYAGHINMDRPEKTLSEWRKSARRYLHFRVGFLIADAKAGRVPSRVVAGSVEAAVLSDGERLRRVVGTVRRGRRPSRSQVLVPPEAS